MVSVKVLFVTLISIVEIFKHYSHIFVIINENMLNAIILFLKCSDSLEGNRHVLLVIQTQQYTQIVRTWIKQNDEKCYSKTDFRV